MNIECLKLDVEYWKKKKKNTWLIFIKSNKKLEIKNNLY